MKISRATAATGAALVLPVLLTALLAACGTAATAAPHTAGLPGGASQFLLSLPRGIPARVTAAGGAGEISPPGSR
jgi:hypothetical protein